MTYRSLLTPALVVFAAAVVPAVSRADINLYTFETPQFTLGEPTPIGPTAPNSGDPSFTTSFAQAGDPGGAFITSGGPPPLSGQVLVTFAAGDLTLTFNQPVFDLSVTFLLDADIADPAVFFELVTPSATFDQSNMAIPGGPFANGILSFSSATPFTTATLDGFGAPGEETPFAIDNLSLTTSSVPEPSSLALLGSALAGIVALRRRKN